MRLPNVPRFQPPGSAFCKEHALPERPDRDTAERRFLFLQGLSTPLFHRLGQSLRERGHHVSRINICAGDYLFWPAPGARRYAGRLSRWPRFLSQYLSDHGITDIVLFGDRRPYHRVAIALAGRRNITVHSFDEGYLRPDWITMESGLDWRAELTRSDLEAMADVLPSPTLHQRVGGGFARRALWDVAFHAVNTALRPLFPFYVRHRPRHPLAEGLGWVRRALGRGGVRRAAAQVQQHIIENRLPLQLDSDFQIRHHSPFSSMQEVMDHVFASFALHAPAGHELLVKVHPLDNGLVNRVEQVAALAEMHGLSDRVRLIDGGHLPTLLAASSGVVVVNSTTGLAAMHHRKPTFALADPIYKLPGLVSPGTLDAFWTGGTPPRAELVAAFERVLADRCQVNGSYFTGAGIDLAVRNITLRLTDGRYPSAVLTPAHTPHRTALP